jgi:hypothetical protein
MVKSLREWVVWDVLIVVARRREIVEVFSKEALLTRHFLVTKRKAAFQS